MTVRKQGGEQSANRGRRHAVWIEHARQSLLVSLTLLFFTSSAMVLADGAQTSDAAWWKGQYQSEVQHNELKRSSYYVTMKDGTRIAVYLALPADLPQGTKLPTILLMTPYVSRMESRTGPPKALPVAPDPGAMSHESFAFYGYAAISMDGRGSGASFGHRLDNWMPDMARDASEVVDWIIEQPWSNGKVGATGVSALGLSSLWLATTQHPAVKAIAPRFCPFDLFIDVHPGGLDSVFVQRIGNSAKLLDQNMNPNAKTVAVDEDTDGKLLEQAVREHEKNEDFATDLLSVHFRDEQLPQSAVPATLDSLSPYSFLKELRAGGIPIYAVGGWMDGAFQRGLGNLHRAVRTPGSRLTIGPWGHGGVHYTSAAVQARATDFDHPGELIRFFDHYLKGIANGIDTEQPVHYFTMAEEQWKAADTWPPAGVREVRYHLAAGNTLSSEGPAATEQADSYAVDYTAGTGDNSRFGVWSAVSHPERRQRDEKLLTYTTTPLEQDMEVTGNPVIKLYVASTITDGAFIAYLEDVAPDGEVTNVTDGVLAANYRKVSADVPPYKRSGPYRTFRKADAMPLVPGEITELEFDLLPTSYLFRKGHSIRIALANADKDIFLPVPADMPPVTVHYYHGGTAHASFVDLPIMPR